MKNLAQVNELIRDLAKEQAIQEDSAVASYVRLMCDFLTLGGHPLEKYGLVRETAVVDFRVTTTWKIKLIEESEDVTEN